MNFLKKVLGKRHIIITADTVEDEANAMLDDAIRLGGTLKISQQQDLLRRLTGKHLPKYTFVFANEKNAMAFRLRWAGETKEEYWI